MKKKAHRFRAELYAVGVNRCVDVPGEISRALGGDKHIPVKGTIRGHAFVSNLTPRGAGRHRLFVHSSIWRALGVDKGDEITVSLELDPGDREAAVPADITESLARDPEAQEAFRSLTVAQRRAFVRYIEEARSSAAREKRMEQGKERILEHYRRKLT